MMKSTTVLFLLIVAASAQEECERKPKYNATYWESQYNFGPLPIGGQIATTVESRLMTEDLPPGYKEDVSRALAIQVYCLMKHNEINIFHSLPSDSAWYFIAGNALRLYIIDQHTRELTTKVIRVGQFAYVKAGDWKAAKIVGKEKEGKYALVMAVNVPGIVPADAKMPSREDMIAMFPEHANIITMLTFP